MFKIPFFRKRRVGWNKLSERFSRHNVLVGRPEKETGRSVIISPEGGNTVIIEEGVWLRGVRIEFEGTGNVVTFKAGCIAFGKFFAADGGTITVGENTKMNKPCWFQAYEGKAIKIGSNCLFADIRVRTSDLHSILSLETGERLNLAKDVVIGDRVWIAEKASLYKGAKIGSGSVIGAHSVVTRSIPKNVVALGIPAKVVQTEIKWVRSLVSVND